MILRYLTKHKKTLAIISGSLFFLLLLFILSVFAGLWGRIPSEDELLNTQLDNATLITDRNGKSLGSLHNQDRLTVEFSEISPHLIDALIATEDVRFYEHDGVDVKSLFRVFFKTLLLGDASSGGGSTISQQLAKNLYPRVGSGTTALVAAKIRESVIANRIEELYSKEEILEKYLNTVPFSDNTYGVERAAKHFFNKPAKNLNVKESALLIGMLKATHTYNPRLFPERSLERRNTVLAQMVKYGKLDSEAFDELSTQELDLNLTRIYAEEASALYFKEQVRKELETWASHYEKETGNTIDIYAEGLQVKTTLDLDMQIKAEASMKQHLKTLQRQFEKGYTKSAPWNNDVLLEKVIKTSPVYKDLKDQGYSNQKIREILQKKENRHVFDWSGQNQKSMSIKDSLAHYLKLLNTGWVSLEASTGAVRTWIGGIDYRFLQYDHVLQSKRQVGSVFKPLVYATAIEEGISPCKHYDLRKVEYENLEGWTPKNTSRKENTDYLNYSMQYALSHSVNTVAVKVLEDAGIDPVINTARNLGIVSDLPRVPSLALGTAEVSVLEIATAYTAFLNEGTASTPYFITSITNRQGEVLYEHQDNAEDERVQAISPGTARVVLEMMRSTIEEGTANRIRTAYHIKSDLGGKTGTTQNNKDGWFVGLSKDLVSVSWVGLDDQRLGFPSTQMGQGANSALPLFALWWKKLEHDPQYKDLTSATFPEADEEITAMLDCEPVKKDGFFKRLFKNPKKTRKRDFKGLSEATE
ncbi:penicillin-binding protein [Robertkochia marina]|uniref:Penicillin-binding protein n=1 Tax=Robertkochia marina TaxID=1227945 RepID=A0A4S3M0G6_9FLAO|nr:transglycosylase domain-containing protein [Robertkochia marina]THD67912.1 penicillin-binding protein [Robertkochia marina]TRZ41019.1 penicillin-binding protein [Robertkochia marina]